MATPQLSPGVLVREVDLTVGRVDNVLDNIGAIAGPFSIGPVDYPVDISTEQELINVFGKPYNTDAQYEYWMSASSFLSYGGVLKVVRTGNDNLVNANALRDGSVPEPTLLIKNPEAYDPDPEESPAYMFAAKTPGTWANGLKVAIIDDKADQILGISTGTSEFVAGSVTNRQGRILAVVGPVLNRTGSIVAGAGNTIGITTSNISLGHVVNCDTADVVAYGSTVTEIGTGYIAISSALLVDDIPSTTFDFGTLTPNAIGITTGSILPGDVVQCNSSNTVSYGSTVTGVGAGYITISSNLLQSGPLTTTFDFGSIVETGFIQPGYAVTTSLTNVVSAGVGVTSVFNGYLKGIVTGVGAEQVEVKIVSIIDTDGNETKVTYAERNQIRSFRPGNVVSISTSMDAPPVATPTLASNAVLDWYDQQKIQLSNGTLYWNSIAPKPITNEYVAERGGLNDGMHVVVFDDSGSISGIKGNILEKHLGLSKALDTISRVNSPQKIWYKDYLASSSKYIYAGLDPSNNETPEEPVYVTGFESDYTPLQYSDGQWGFPALGITFNAIGNALYTLDGGGDYGGSSGFNVQLGDIFNSYALFENRDEIAVDYLIMGPGFSTKSESQAKANYLISIAEQRKDCIAVISPHRDDVVNVPNSEDQTNNVIEFYSSLSGNGDQGGVQSSSYAVFDSGYKYTYDKFNNRFRYIPCNADIAGLMVRTSILAYPWYSPAGQQRGVLNNAVKLAYNPSKFQRDRLYPHRVNAIINQPGVGVVLYGDKTALGYASAFDRINVRRLFLTIEQALQSSAQAQLFELNDELTRAAFVNIVDPYLRDVQAKRGIIDYRIICDITNNTPEVIDNNEFRADIFIKPVKSINYVTLTFVATRTGVSFEEVAGRV